MLAREGEAPAEPERRNAWQHLTTQSGEQVRRERLTPSLSAGGRRTFQRPCTVANAAVCYHCGVAPIVTHLSVSSRMAKRKHPTHGILAVDDQPTIIFDTVCTKHRKPWLACDLVHEVFREVLSQAVAWRLGRYVIMPDHIHFFAGYHPSEYLPYENWIRYWKSQISKKLKRPDWEWLPDHWDTRMRNALAYENKWLYVEQNPYRAELVAHAADWPYRGEIFPLRWD